MVKKVKKLSREEKKKVRLVSSSPLKAAIFSLAYEPFFGGAEIAVKEISARLPHISFTCFTNRFDRRWASIEQMGNVSVVRVGVGKVGGSYYGRTWEKIMFVFRAWWAAEALYKKEKFDFIWAVMASYAGIAALFFKMRHPRVPLLLTLQEGDSESHILGRVGIFYPFWRKVFQKADFVQVISNYLKDFAKRHGARAPIEVVPNGVAVEAIETALKNKKAKLKNKGPFVIITTSRLVPKNGIDTLIYAAAAMKNQKVSNFLVVIIGDGPESSRLKSLARSLKLGEEVDFVGALPPEDIPRELVYADLFVRSSRSEGLGNSFLEAMAAGLPIIGTPVGGIPDFLRDPHIVGMTKANGIFAEPNHPADLAAKIMIIMKNKTLAGVMAKNGRSLIKKQYSWDFIAMRMGKIFTNLCGY